MDTLPTPLKLLILHHLLTSPYYICRIKPPPNNNKTSRSTPSSCPTAIFAVSKRWLALAQRTFFSSNVFVFWDGAWETLTLPFSPRAGRRLNYYDCAFTTLNDLSLTSAVMHLQSISLMLGYHLQRYRAIFEKCLPRLCHLKMVEFNIHCCWGEIMKEADPAGYLDSHTAKLYELMEGCCGHVAEVRVSRKEFRREDYHKQYLWVEQMVWWRNVRWRCENGGVGVKRGEVLALRRRERETEGWGYERMCRRYHVPGNSVDEAGLFEEGRFGVAEGTRLSVIEDEGDDDGLDEEYQDAKQFL